MRGRGRGTSGAMPVSARSPTKTRPPMIACVRRPHDSLYEACSRRSTGVANARIALASSVARCWQWRSGHAASLDALVDPDGSPPVRRPRVRLLVFDALAERGGTAPQIVSVAMEGGTWRLTELQAGTAFTVTQADCDHAGNRSTGRDRVVVTWKNADQSQSIDHLDIRYCKP